MGKISDMSTEASAQKSRPRIWVARIGLVLLGLVAMGSTGCGYSNQSLYRDSVRTVYVDMFQTREFRRGIEFQVTEALRKEIERRTPYKNAPRNRADTLVEGEILEWREAAIAKDFVTDQARENAATLSIRFRWKDMRTGKLLVDKPNMVTTVQYVKPAHEESYEGYQQAAEQISRRIVEAMESPW
jgi:hypothetical protein